jgi:hypothetical protein
VRQGLLDEKETSSDETRQVIPDTVLASSARRLDRSAEGA